MAPPLNKWKILSKTFLTHDVFELKLNRPEGVNFKAGQYMSIVIPGAGPGGRNLRRAYSIASAPEQNEVELCVKIVEGGPGTTYLNRLAEGDEFEAQAPFGDFVITHDPKLPTMFLGTGTGIAPFRSMILSRATSLTGPISFLLGVREEKDILYPELFEETSGEKAYFSKNPLAKICLSKPSSSWKGYQGRVTHFIRALDETKSWDFASAHYYLCGSGAMLSEIKDFLMNEKAVQKTQIHTEKYY